MRRRTGPSALPPHLLAAVLLAACAGAPPPVPDPENRLAEAEALTAAGRQAEAIDLLESFGYDAFPVRLRDRFDLALASALLADGEPWDAYEVLEKFPDRHPFSERMPAAAELVWRAARTLAERGSGFLFFWSDRDGARSALEHLVTRHPECERLADALRLLGDIAFEDGDYEMAKERFRDLLRRRPKSSWETYARFRFAMSIFAGLRGPEYDRRDMEQAHRELQAFLATKSEDPRFTVEAAEALRTVREWLSDSHLRTAHFYRTIGNSRGQRLHLKVAAGAEFASTAAHAEAVAELAELGPEPAEPRR